MNDRVLILNYYCNSVNVCKQYKTTVEEKYSTNAVVIETTMIWLNWMNFYYQMMTNLLFLAFLSPTTCFPALGRNDRRLK